MRASAALRRLSMPSRDENGKPLSGAALRKRARERRTVYAMAVAAETPGSLPSVADFGQLVAPPIGKPSEAAAWATDVVLLAMSQAMRDAALSSPERWRWIKDLSGVLGQLRDKTADQRKLIELQREVAELRSIPAQHAAHDEEESMVNRYLGKQP